MWLNLHKISIFRKDILVVKRGHTQKPRGQKDKQAIKLKSVKNIPQHILHWGIFSFYFLFSQKLIAWHNLVLHLQIKAENF